MRILFVSNLYPPFSLGGYEQICCDVARGLQAGGHDVQVLTSSYRARELAEEEAGVHRLLKLRSTWISPPDCRSTALGRSWPEVDLHNFRAFHRMLGTLHPNVVMIWNGGHLGPALLWAAEMFGAVSYYLSDGWLAPMLAQQRIGSTNRLSRRLYRCGLSAITTTAQPIRADHLIFCSQALRLRYERVGADVAGSTLIYHGVSADEFSLQPQHILTRGASEPFRVLFSGRVSADKGVPTLVAAMAKLRGFPGMEHVRLSLLGGMHSAEFDVELRRQIAELELEDAVEFLPHRARSELPAVYSKHDVMAFTSEWEEPFALTLLHGMAVGIPVVSTLRGGSADIVRDGENAIACQAGDSDDLALKLRWMLTHPEDAAAIGRTAGEEVRRCYSLESQVGRVEAWLRACARGV